MDELKITLRARQGNTRQTNTKQPHVKALTLGRRQNQRVVSPSIKHLALNTDKTSHPHALVYLYHMIPTLPTEQTEVNGTTRRSEHRKEHDDTPKKQQAAKQHTATRHDCKTSPTAHFLSVYFFSTSKLVRDYHPRVDLLQTHAASSLARTHKQKTIHIHIESLNSVSIRRDCEIEAIPLGSKQQRKESMYKWS